MHYRGWTIRTHSTYLGYSAQYTSPIGHTHQIGAYLPSNQDAVTYAKLMIDYLLHCERTRFQEMSRPTSRLSGIVGRSGCPA
jgi:hypothetical protein